MKTQKYGQKTWCTERTLVIELHTTEYNQKMYK